MNLLAGALPYIVIVGVLGLTLLMVRLNHRVNRGSRSAGPRKAERPAPIGLTATPWELEAIDLQLSADADSPARRDLVATVNRLIAASRDRSPRAPLALSASNAQIEEVVADLEAKLDLSNDR